MSSTPTRSRLKPYNPALRHRIEEGMGMSGDAPPPSEDGHVHMWKDAPGNETHPEGIVVALCGTSKSVRLAGHWGVIDCDDCRRIGEERS